MTFDSLPFVKITNGVRSNWNVAPSGDYADDCATGAAYFAQLKSVVDATGNLQLVPYVLHDMIRSGEANGIEVGFLTAMSASLA